MPAIMDDLRRLLDHLEQSADPAAQQRIARRHRNSLEYRPVDRPPLICTFPYPADAPFQPLPLSRIYDDPAAMLYNELVHAFDTSIALSAQLGDDLPWTVRPNFGTTVVASLFDARIERIGENPPWVRPFESRRQFCSALDRDPRDVSGPTMHRLRDSYAFFVDMIEPYPQLGRCIRFVLPDLQGPFDTAEQLRGSEIFTDLYSDPDLVDFALRRIAETQSNLARALQDCLREPDADCAHQHATMIRGRILLRNDTAIMISPEMYRDQVAPWDDHVLAQLDGGGIHACGCFDRHVDAFLSLPGLRCIDLGQSWLNDIDTMYRKARARSIPLVRIRATEEDLVTGGILGRFPTGVTLVHDAPTLADARRVAAAWRRHSALVESMEDQG